jgi:hypothetical protein
MGGPTRIIPRRGASSLVVLATIGLVGALTMYAAVSALSDGHWLSPWRLPLLAGAGLWLAAALAMPAAGRRLREAPPPSGDLGCSDRY